MSPLPPVRLLAVGFLVLLAASVAAPPLGAAAGETPDRTRVTEPFSGAVTNACGEDALVTGEVLVSFVGVEDAYGGRHGTQLRLLRHVTAVGVESGTPYRAVDVEHAGGSADADLAPLGSTEVGSFLLVGKVGAPKFRAHGTLHYQVDGNGEGKAAVDFGRAECVGGREE